MEDSTSDVKSYNSEQWDEDPNNFNFFDEEDYSGRGNDINSSGIYSVGADDKRRSDKVEELKSTRPQSKHGHFGEFTFKLDEHGKVTSIPNGRRRTRVATHNYAEKSNTDKRINSQSRVQNNTGRHEKGNSDERTSSRPNVQYSGRKSKPQSSGSKRAWKPKRNKTRGARDKQFLQRALGDVTAELMGERDFNRDRAKDNRDLDNEQKMLDSQEKERELEEKKKQLDEQRELLIKQHLSGMIGKTYRLTGWKFPLLRIITAFLSWLIVGTLICFWSNDFVTFLVYFFMSFLAYLGFFGFRVPGEPGTVKVLKPISGWTNMDFRSEFARRGDMTLSDARFMQVEIQTGWFTNEKARRIVSIELLAQMLGPNITLETKAEDVHFKMSSVAKTNTAINLNKYDFADDEDIVSDTLELAKVIYSFRQRRRSIWHF